ncbi:GSCFA domain-containing protein, partial [Vreelandella titanicae]
MNNPYKGLPEKNFWGKAVRDRHYYDLDNLSQPIDLKLHYKIATAGSCFAQHIGRHLQRSGFKYLDMEPKPSFIDDVDAKRFGYNVYSCRYGNIYSTRQLLQLTQEALGYRQPQEIIWTRNGRYFDALRPSVDPVGYDDSDSVFKSRKKHLAAVKMMLEEVDVFVFTLGLTEAWVSTVDETVYPTAAGTIA